MKPPFPHRPGWSWGRRSSCSSPTGRCLRQPVSAAGAGRYTLRFEQAAPALVSLVAA